MKEILPRDHNWDFPWKYDHGLFLFRMLFKQHNLKMLICDSLVVKLWKRQTEAVWFCILAKLPTFTMPRMVWCPWKPTCGFPPQGRTSSRQGNRLSRRGIWNKKQEISKLKKCLVLSPVASPVQQHLGLLIVAPGTRHRGIRAKDQLHSRAVGVNAPAKAF